MSKNKSISSIEDSARVLLHSSDRIEKMKAGAELQSHALNVMERPRLRRRFSQLIAPALMQEIISFQKGRENHFDVAEQNIEIVGLLGKEALAQVPILSSIHERLATIKPAVKARRLKECIEYAIERVHTDAYQGLSISLVSSRTRLKQRVSAVENIGNLLTFWAVRSFNEQRSRKIIIDLLHAAVKDPAPAVMVKALSQLTNVINSPVFEKSNSQLRIKIISALINTFSIKRHIKYRGRRIQVRSVSRRMLKKCQYSDPNDMEKILRLYRAESDLFVDAENRIAFLNYFIGYVTLVKEQAKNQHLPSSADLDKTVRKLERLYDKEANNKVRLRLRRAQSIITEMKRD